MQINRLKKVLVFKELRMSKCDLSEFNREGKAMSKMSRKERCHHTIIGSLSCTLRASRSHGRVLVRKISQILKGQMTAIWIIAN